MPPVSPETPERGTPGSEAWADFATARRRELRERGRWREPRAFDARGPRGWLGGEIPRHVVAFASNDYLGLSAHPAVVAAARAALDRWGAGSGSARLVTGSRPVHHELERGLASWKGQDRAALFPTGFATNLGVLTALGEPGVRILSDELNHASIIDGARLARATVAVYRHGDLDHLHQLLSGGGGRTIVVSDLVFSMDGDEAPLAGLAELCRRHGALLVLDEAHAVFDSAVTGAIAGLDVLRVGTLSKALGSQGGFVAGPSHLVELVENCARSYIFTTAPAPAAAAAALEALRIVRSPEGDGLQARLARHVARLRPGHRSPVVPVVLGGEEEALAASARLLADGFWVPAIRPPTVPAGTARLRVTLSAAHTDDEVDRLAVALEGLRGSALAGGAEGVSATQAPG